MRLLLTRVESRKGAASKAAAQIIADGVSREAPVGRPRGRKIIRRGGTLRRSIRVYTDGDRAIVAADESARSYIGFVQFGTKYKKANSFMNRGFNRNKRRAQGKYLSIIKVS